LPLVEEDQGEEAKVGKVGMGGRLYLRKQSLGGGWGKGAGLEDDVGENQ